MDVFFKQFKQFFRLPKTVLVHIMKNNCLTFQGAIFCLEQFGSFKNYQFKFWHPDCSLSALGRISWFHTNREDHSYLISKIELKISTSGKMGAIFRDCKNWLKMCSDPCSLRDPFTSFIHRNINTG